MKRYKDWIILFPILAAAYLLRVFNIGANFFVSGEIGSQLLYLRHYALTGKLPLVGLATSHEWLRFGPFYNWIALPFFELSAGDPSVVFWISMAASLIGLVITFFVVKKIINCKLALIVLLFEVFSPVLIWQTKASRFYFFIYPLMVAFMYFLYQLWKGEKKWVFWAGVLFGFSFSFHFSQLPMIGVVALLFWVKRKIYEPVDWGKFFVGLIIPNVTLLWTDRNLALWLPYRILNIATKDPGGTFNGLVEYFGRTLFGNHALWGLGLIIFVVAFVHYTWRNWRSVFKDFLPFYLISTISLVLIANVLHGGTPVHYFLPLFAVTPILFAIYIEKFKYAYFLIFLFSLLNLNFYVVPERSEDYVPYRKQIEAANFIVANSQGKPFSLTRVGPYDYFSENYSQGYQYLVLWKGGDLLEGSSNTYTIVEQNNDVYVQK